MSTVTIGHQNLWSTQARIIVGSTCFYHNNDIIIKIAAIHIMNVLVYTFLEPGNLAVNTT